jgi:hypothetical protein
MFELGLGATKAGFDVSSRPVLNCRGRLYLVFGSDAVEALTSARLADTDNDGAADTVGTTTAKVVASVIDEASLTWSPPIPVSVRVGRFRVPFTAQAKSADTALLFPSRASPTSVFVGGSDLGVLASVVGGELVSLGVGVFNGTGLSAGTGSEKGALLTARFDLTPLGEFAFDEAPDGNRSPRLGLGAGLLWHPAVVYDGAGEPSVRVQDFRGSFGGRMAVGGLYLAAEGLGRYQTDSLTSRPVIAWGGYAQGSVSVPPGVEPLARVGLVEEDVSFDPQTVAFLEAGLNGYPGWGGEQPDAVRLTALYMGELRLTEGEPAHGLALRAQLKW